jgi:hypothetical protein
LSGDERGWCRHSHGVRTHSAQIHVIILHPHAWGLDNNLCTFDGSDS